MLDYLQNIKWIRGTRAVGLQVSMMQPDLWEFHIVQLHRKRNTAYLQQIQKGLTSFDQVRQKLSGNLPVSINLDGKGIFHKVFDTHPGEHPMNKVMPNAREEDFYVQITHAASHYWVSVVRKDVLEELLLQCKKSKIKVADISLGPFSLAYSGSSLLKEDTSFQNEFWQISMNHGDVEFEKINNTGESDFVIIGDDTIPGVAVPVYAQCINYLYSVCEPATHIAKALQEAFLFRRATHLWGRGLLVIAFVVLLINFFVFSHYNKRYNEATKAMHQQGSLLKRADKLQVRYIEKREFVTRSGFLENSMMSFYADRIARFVPDSLFLNAITVHPLKQKMRKGKPVRYAVSTIKVGGACTHSRFFNQWKDRIKKLDWVQEFYIHAFGQPDKGEPIVFEVLIKIREDE